MVEKRIVIDSNGNVIQGPVCFTSDHARKEEVKRDDIMKFFEYKHLPPNLAEKSKPFCDLAEWIHATLPRNAERSTALRKLLEAKDCAVRASIP